jgi:hypothetical protein
MTPPPASRRWPALAAVAVLLLAAAAALASMRSASDSAATPGAPPLASLADAPALTLTRAARVDGNVELLGRLGHAAVAPNGDVAVHDQSDKTYMIISPEGVVRRRLGGAGQGPGEFSSPMRAGFLGDTLWVGDPVARRITMFDPDGRVVSIVSYAPREVMGSWSNLLPPELRESAVDFWYWWPDALTPAGEAIVFPSLINERTVPAPKRPVIVAGRDMRPLRVLALLPGEEVSFERGSGPDRMTRYIGAPFGAEVLASVVSPGGSRLAIVTADYESSKIRIVQLAASGDTLSDSHVGFVPRAVSTSTLESLAGDYAAIHSADERQVRSALERLPQWLPPVSGGAILEDDGTLWLARATMMVVNWLGITPEGVVRGEFSLPMGQYVLAFDGADVWINEMDVDEVPSIVRYTIGR